MAGKVELSGAGSDLTLAASVTVTVLTPIEGERRNENGNGLF